MVLIVDNHISRRNLIKAAAVGAGSLTLSSAGAVSPRSYAGPNVIIVRFGGGVRRRETIEPAHTHAPWLLNSLAPRGTLFRNVLIDDAAHVQTNHGQGTLYLLTGRYDRLENLSDRLFGERLEPPSPTLFEYFRHNFDVPSDQALIVNGEDRTSEEFYTFSNHHQYGIRYRSEVLSLFRFKTWLLRTRLAEDRFDNDNSRRKALRNLAEMTAIDARRSEADGQSPRLEAFWERWRTMYGDSGLKNPRGDRLITDLAIDAMTWLKPRLMLLNYQDPDYVHWGYPSHYTRGITTIDQSLRTLFAFAEHDEHYANNTCFVVVPDCGRDANLLVRTPFQHHFNSRSAHEIWALVVGPGVERGRVVDREVQQIDVGKTIAAYMDFPASSMSGEVLRESFA